MNHMMRGTLTLGLLLVLSTIGCQNPTPTAGCSAQRTSRSSQAAAQYQPQDSLKLMPGTMKEPAGAGRAAGVRRSRRRRGNSTSTC